MINTIADLLEKLRDAEKEKIQQLKLTHRPTIGNNYEGLTASLLEKAVFKDLNLKVICNSFILTPSGRSSEMDIMIIEGEGKKYPYSEQYDVSFKQVLAVIQVKKKLNKRQLGEAYFNLREVYNAAELDEFPAYSQRMFRDAYRGICGEDVFLRGRERKAFSSGTKELIYHLLRIESILPARIVFGYEGYKSEYSLRKGFLEFLNDYKSDEKQGYSGFGPVNFPDLIINRDYSIIKSTGMPFVGKMIGYQWPFLVTSSTQPLLKMLEVIWTRLSYRYNLPMSIFGEDLDIDALSALTLANIVNVGGQRGWNYEAVELAKVDLEKRKNITRWEPVYLDDAQAFIVAELCLYGTISIREIENHLISSDSVMKISEFLDSLYATGLIFEENEKLHLLTDECQVAYVPNIGYVAADNKSGRLSRWVKQKQA